MRELTFFTTNQTKVAHARYVAEDRQVRIKGFRQRTYHADYIEPRLTSREDILRASYKAAKAQLAKAGFSETSHPFFLEDTSVRIDALSTPEREVPGVDIKYWMEDRTFSSLDALLRHAGNDRRATVRSDVLLHIPSSFRADWDVNAEFLVFTGEQRGTIVETEYIFGANLVYPWLDNRSFNKWFVPEGVDTPFGALPIEIADTVDFRRKSFEPLFDFLEARRYFAIPVTQLQLQFDHKPNIILCGYTCSGKTTASQHLARRFGYVHIEASDFMHLAYYYRHGYRGPTPIGDFAESALAQKPTIAAEKVADYILDHLDEPIVISWFRAPAEIEFLENKMKLCGKTFVRWFVSAAEAIRFKRLLSRARSGDDIAIGEFRARDRQQQRMGLDAISQWPEVLSIRNEDSLEAYLQQIDILAEEGGVNEIEIDIESGLATVARISEVGLQDSVLIALLGVWKNDETRQFYTTTEVSALIARTFPAIRRKHKDNVSRYFNQDFYAYYEISIAPKTATRKYRLSNTGYGMAISRLRALLKA
jgi:inosine/xanthosine triphosphate pyrophosphatase family protein/adenylate kinase family enzyme